MGDRIEVEVVLGAGWPHALAQLAEHIDTRKVYDPGLPALAAAFSDVLLALNRRPAWRRQHPS